MNWRLNIGMLRQSQTHFLLCLSLTLSPVCRRGTSKLYRTGAASRYVAYDVRECRVCVARALLSSRS